MHDSFRLIGQDNLRRYRAATPLRIRVHPEDSAFEVLARVAAARIARCPVTLSTPPDAPHACIPLLGELAESEAAALELVEESDAALAEAIRSGLALRVRYAAPERVGEGVWRAAAEVGAHLAVAPVLAIGRLELLHYLHEQTLCVDYHRYGNLGSRAAEARAPVE